MSLAPSLKLLLKPMTAGQLIKRTVHLQQKPAILRLRKQAAKLKLFEGNSQRVINKLRTVNRLRKENAKRIGIKFVRIRGRVVPIRPKRT